MQKSGITPTSPAWRPVFLNGRLTHLSLFGAKPMSSLAGVYFGTWNCRSLCCGSTSHLKINGLFKKKNNVYLRPLWAQQRCLRGTRREWNVPGDETVQGKRTENRHLCSPDTTAKHQSIEDKQLDSSQSRDKTSPFGQEMQTKAQDGE